MRLDDDVVGLKDIRNHRREHDFITYTLLTIDDDFLAGRAVPLRHKADGPVLA